uniref:integrin beta-3-like n=1 Tax=Myxine glutinosa TaxID=7769 RepID=UPI0035902B50
MKHKHVSCIPILATILLVVVKQVFANRCLLSNVFSCRGCLLIHPDCAWCGQKEFESSRCDTPTMLLQHGCRPEAVEKSTSIVRIDKDEKLSSKSSASVGEPFVQLSPQEVFATIMPGAAAKFKVKVRQVEDYPVDVYYLMDLSRSMKMNLYAIQQLGTKLAQEMTILTSNFRLGFGTFVDKPISPFSYTYDRPSDDPCVGSHSNRKCTPTFGFKNVLSLTDKVDHFNEQVQLQSLSRNRDSPEGGPDAILQVSVCTKEIGWRKDASHLLVFATDADSHFALDGRLAGLLKPNDGLCHLNAQNLYDGTDKQDYPSIAQLIEKLSFNNINIIFAVTNKYEEQYKKYEEIIPGSSVGTLNSDSTNVLQLIIKSYKSIRSKVELEVRDQPEDLSVSFTATCQDGEVRPGERKCTDVTIGDTVSFEVTVESHTCPVGPTVEQTLQLTPIGFPDTLHLRVKLACGCSCEKDALNNSVHCNEHGSFECGMCHCNQGWLGETCRCNSSDVGPGIQLDQSACSAAGPGQPVCSARGDCVCGTCMCHSSPYGLVSGKFCECDDFSCARHSDQLCAGHGDCHCGICRCHNGWAGDVCNCTMQTYACESPDGRMCSDRGQCVCGQCECTTPGSSGKTCERCPTCSDFCMARRDCVECQLFHTGRLSNETLCSRYCKDLIERVDSIEEPINDMVQVCTYKDENDCVMRFTYKEDAFGSATMAALKKPECPEGPDILAVVLSVVGGILLVGLGLLLVWKILVCTHDRREYARFTEECSRPHWESGMNPLYKQTVSTFKNVTYKSGSTE